MGEDQRGKEKQKEDARDQGEEHRQEHGKERKWGSGERSVKKALEELGEDHASQVHHGGCEQEVDEEQEQSQV